MKLRIAAFVIVLLLLRPAGAVHGAPGPSIGLALGSGGAGGLAHIAVLQAFDDLGVKPDRIAGTSIGAVMGALYAGGMSAQEIRAVFATYGGTGFEAFSRLLDPSAELTLGDLLRVDIADGGLIESSGFLAFLAGKVEARKFAELEIPLEVVATDYWSGETVVLDSGDLFDAVAASMAVPGLFSPVPHGDQLLIDGGTSNPLPSDLLDGRYDIVIAVDVSGTRRRGGPEEGDGLSDVVFNTFEIMQQSIIAARRRVSEPDIYLKPDTGGVRLLHFHRIETILEQARPAAERLKAALREAGIAEQPSR
ncbi:patatin-like phospholipase family protein [Arhodomonas sp. SL1]|uniref:patatin-like phospholipase family protein n=1 Tax=Arhodomonas sp. SL1 TaxID=3425691 RepID=UPI003F8853E4